MTDCMVRGCGASSGSSLHYLPKDPELRQKWVDFIYQNRPVPDSVDRVRICSVHFTEGCFTNYRQKLMGFSKRLILTPTAVPTVDLLTDAHPGPEPDPDPSAVPNTEPDLDPQPAAPNPQEKTKCEKRDNGPLWLCPLCQQPKRERRNLASHLTKKHSVLPSCLVKLLDSASPILASSDGEESSAQNSDGKVQESSENPKSSNPPIILIVSQNKNGSGAADSKESSTQDKVKGQRKKKSDSKESKNETISSDKSTNKSDAQSDAGQLFKCDVCLEVFPRRSALNAHNNSPSHIERTKIVANDGELMRALLRRYVSYKPYQCDVCNVAYSHAITLESHLKSVLHQTRARSAAKAAKSRTNVGGKKVGAKVAKTTTEKSTTEPPTPLTPAQALSAYLPVLSFTPSSIVPSVFATPTTTSPPAGPHPQMLLVKGPKTKKPSAKTKSVPHKGWSQEPSLTQGICPSQSHSDASTETSAPSEENDDTGVKREVKVKIEIKEEPCEEEVSQVIVDDWTVASGVKLELKQEHTSVECTEEVEDATETDHDGHVKGKRSASRKASSSADLSQSEPPVLNELQPEVHQVLQLTEESWRELESKQDNANLAHRDQGGRVRGVQKRVASRKASANQDLQDQERQPPGLNESTYLAKTSKTKAFVTNKEDEDQTPTNKKRKTLIVKMNLKHKRRGRRRTPSYKSNSAPLDDR